MKLQALLAVIMMFVPIVADTHEITSGINPDSVLWGLDVALDKISLALTRTPEKRAEKALEIAQERLMEVKAMVEGNKIEAAAKAESEHESTIKEVEKSVSDLSEDDPEEQIQKELELETKLKEHRDSIEKVKTELKIKIQVEGDLTNEQQALLDVFLASLSKNTEDVKVQIQNKKDGTKIKIKEKTGETEDEIEQRIERLEIEHGLLEEDIEVSGKVIGNKTYVKIRLEYDSEKTGQNEILTEFLEKFYLNTNKADALLEMEKGDEGSDDSLIIKIKSDDEGSEVKARLNFVVDFTQRDQVVDAIVSKTKLSLSEAEASLSIKTEQKESDEIEIEVETEGNTSRVKIKFGGEKTRFELDTTNQAEILSAIASQLGLSVEDINNFVKFEDEDGNEIENEVERKEKKEDVEVSEGEREDEKIESKNNETLEESDSDDNKLEVNEDANKTTTFDEDTNETKADSDIYLNMSNETSG
ncbi:MAG: hypothetical protein GOV01_02045 [Candidatus Altiarchaeota archaeon]|nr:hypothetical protein [Candidatus Altiarchaeota archaeon]